MAKKNNRQLRSRTTRSSKPRLLTDPTSSTQLLTTQLQSLGLYAAHTIGDGNCLFRALSDQVHGSPEKHRQVRKQICDWIEQHKESYEGFVEDDDYLVDGKRGTKDKGKGLEAHLRCMRENATYGGHMELSAFAHLTKRNIKVIQPGLVYVIEWNAGESSQPSTNSTSNSSSSKSQDQDSHPEPRRSKRTQRSSVSSSSSSPKQSSNPNQEIVKIGTGKHGYYVYEEVSDTDDDNNEQELEESLKQDVEDDQGGEEGESGGGETVYVAYHDWEHFSSIRNLRGPHAGLPHVRETPAQSLLAQREHEREALKEREREKKRKDKEREREIKKTNVMKVKLKLSSPGSTATTPAPQPIAISASLSSLSSCSSLTSIGSTNASTTTAVTADPTLIPLPNSRSVSPFPPIPFSPTSATAQSHINPDTQTDSTFMSTSTSPTPLPPISIPTISPPIPATPTSPTSTPVSSSIINTIHSPHAHSHLHQHLHQHQHRSPKRTFDESSASGEDGDGGSGGSTRGSGCSGREKRSRVGSVVGGRSRLGTGSGGDADADNMDPDRDNTPGLSAPGSSSSSSATSPDSSSDITSPSPPPQQSLVEPPPPPSKSPKSKKGMKFSYGINNTNLKGGSKPLTRRQRKALGLPKTLSTPPAGAGKIIIPGGKWTGRQSHSTAVSVVEGEGGEGDEEWRRNGTGRVDVRGFRELKI